MKGYTLDEKIAYIKDAILKYVPAKYIYLFGSYAYGKPHDNSDIDIYAVIPDNIESILFLYGDIYGELRRQSIMDDIDIHLNKESNFNYRKTRSMFEKNILEKGKLIYELA